MIKDEFFILNNGVKIPKIGFGTWQIPCNKATSAVVSALNNGYRHIDNAIAYGNAKEVGEGIKKSFLTRDEVFITSKIPAEVKNYQDAKKCIEEALQDLDVDYIDLMLIHAPRPWAQMHDNSIKLYHENIEVYRALEEAYKEGKLKAIGVSNFAIDDLENIINNCEVLPQVNQICIHIGNTPRELIDYCEKHHILVEAYSPIATGRLLNNEGIKLIADKYGVSIPQLCIKYCLEINTLPLPKSDNEDHIKDNIKIDFEITKEDIDYLSNF